MERPAGAALAALGDSAVPPSILIASIRKLDARGFASLEFRSDTARCLRAIARRADGLDDATCALLEGWITDWRPDVADEEVRAGNERAKISSEEESTEVRRGESFYGVTEDSEYSRAATTPSSKRSWPDISCGNRKTPTVG